MNLTRIGNWAADGFTARKEKIRVFLKNTDQYFKSLDKTKFPKDFAPTYTKFRNEYRQLRKGKSPKDPLAWAEKLLTWGNILTHRANLLN